jgi:hypothetical protein
MPASGANVRYSPDGTQKRTFRNRRLVPILLQKYFEHFVAQH